MTQDRHTYTVTFHGFISKEEAEAFAGWYEGQGEQDVTIWLECRRDESPDAQIRKYIHVDVGKPYRWVDDNLKVFLEED
jgi:hypothetical protein